MSWAVAWSVLAGLISKPILCWVRCKTLRTESRTYAWLKLRLCEQGNQCFKEARYAEAIECYTLAISFDNKYAVLYANRAMALLKQEKWVHFWV